MENEKVNGGDSGVDGGDKSSITNDATTTIATTELVKEQNPNSTTTAGEVTAAAEPITRQSSRTPFTNLSQVDADLALARTLQEQERAFMMLSGNNVGSDYGSWETGSMNDEDLEDDHDDDDDDDGDEDGEEDDDDEDDDDVNEYDDEDEDGEVEGEDDDEDAFDVHAQLDIGDDNIPSVEIDPSAYPDDEAYARALQDAEERELVSRLLALEGLNDRQIDDVDVDDGDDGSQDTWEDVDPDELSYEELIALGDVVGTQSRGLSTATIESLRSVKYKAQENQDSNNDTCVICRLDYEDDDTLTVLSCKHSYHSGCINNWLQINKVCPVCNAEISAASENK